MKRALAATGAVVVAAAAVVAVVMWRQSAAHDAQRRHGDAAAQAYEQALATWKQSVGGLDLAGNTFSNHMIAGRPETTAELAELDRRCSRAQDQLSQLDAALRVPRLQSVSGGTRSSEYRTARARVQQLERAVAPLRTQVADDLRKYRNLCTYYVAGVRSAQLTDKALAAQARYVYKGTHVVTRSATSWDTYTCGDPNGCLTGWDKAANWSAFARAYAGQIDSVRIMQKVYANGFCHLDGYAPFCDAARRHYSARLPLMIAYQRAVQKLDGNGVHKYHDKLIDESKKWGKDAAAAMHKVKPSFDPNRKSAYFIDEQQHMKAIEAAMATAAKQLAALA